MAKQSKDARELALNKMLDRIVEQALAHEQDWSSYYEDGIRYLMGDQLYSRIRADGWENVVLNRLTPAMLQELSLQTQVRRTIVAQPTEPDDTDGAKVWQGILQWVYREQNMAYKTILARLDGKANGHYCWRIDWNERGKWNNETRQWEPRLEIHNVRRELLHIDPNATSYDDAAWVFEYQDIPTDVALQTYPEFKEEILSAAAASIEDTHGNIGGIRITSLPVQDGAAVTGEVDDGQVRDPRANRLADLLLQPNEYLAMTPEDSPIGRSYATEVRITRAWLRDATIEKRTDKSRIPVETLLESGAVERDAEGRNVIKSTGELLDDDNWPTVENSYEAPKYPYGRYVVRVGEKAGQHTILVDEPWERPCWPHEVGQNLPLFHTWHGLNHVELTRMGQDALNLAGSYLHNALKNFGINEACVEDGAFSDDRANKHPERFLASRPGAVLKLAAGGLGKYERRNGPPVPDSVMSAMSVFSDQVREDTGMYEQQSTGKTRPGQTATEAEITAVATRLRTALQDFCFQQSMERLFRKVHLTLKHHMTVGDYVRIIGDGDKTQKLVMDAVTMDAHFDLSIETTTVLPFDKERRIIEAKDAYTMFPCPTLARRVLESMELSATVIEQVLIEMGLAPGMAAAAAEDIQGGEAMADDDEPQGEVMEDVIGVDPTPLIGELAPELTPV